MANQAKDFYDDYKAFFGDGTSTDTEQALSELQEALQALQDYVDTLPTEDTDTVFDPTPINEAIAALQQDLQTNSDTDETNVTALQNAITALQDYVNTLPTEDTDTIFDPTPLNESISVLQTSLQQFREQAEIAQAQQAAALAANAQIDVEQQQSITDLTSRVTTLEAKPDQTKVIGYQDATAQEIIEFYEQNPHAALIVDNGGEQHTTLFFLKKSDSSCIIRHLGTINGVWHVFQHTIDNQRWTSVTYPFQDKLESGTSIKTINGESLLGSGNIEIQSGVQTDNDTQADWDETDDTSPAFIQNKPNIPVLGEPVTIAIPELIMLPVFYDNITVPAGGRINLQTEPSEALPEGFKIVGFYQISKLKGSNAVGNDTTWQKVFIESFSTAGGQTKPNVSFFNGGATDSLIRVNIGCLCMKTTQYTVFQPTS